MISVLAPLALTASTGALLVLPLAPALRELLSKRDAGPLVTRKDDGKISNFAASLRTRCIPFQHLMTECLERHRNAFFELPQGKIFVAAKEGVWTGPQHVDVLTLCATLAELPEQFRALEDFYSASDVCCGPKGLFRALLAEGDILLGQGTRVLRWIHAEGDLHVCRDCLLYGRASAGSSLTLARGCTFERVYAPVIYSSCEGAGLETRNESSAFSKLAQAGMGRTRYPGNAHVVAGEEHRGDLVTTKGLSLEQGSSVFGSVKANGDVHLRECAQVDGSVVSTRSIRIAPGCFAKGPIISEDEIIIDRNVQVGLPGSPTTVSAPRIRIAPGSVLHGTVWARVEGRVGD